MQAHQHDLMMSSLQGCTTTWAACTVYCTAPNGWISVEAGLVKIGNPQGLDASNPVLWSFGCGKRLANRVYLLGSAFGNGSLLPGYGASAEVGPGLGFVITDRLNVTVVPSTGLSKTSASFGLTIGVSSSLRR